MNIGRRIWRPGRLNRAMEALGGLLEEIAAEPRRLVTDENLAPVARWVREIHGVLEVVAPSDGSATGQVPQGVCGFMDAVERDPDLLKRLEGGDNVVCWIRRMNARLCSHGTVPLVNKSRIPVPVWAQAGSGMAAADRADSGSRRPAGTECSTPSLPALATGGCAAQAVARMFSGTQAAASTPAFAVPSPGMTPGGPPSARRDDFRVPLGQSPMLNSLAVQQGGKLVECHRPSVWADATPTAAGGAGTNLGAASDPRSARTSPQGPSPVDSTPSMGSPPKSTKRFKPHPRPRAGDRGSSACDPSPSLTTPDLAESPPKSTARLRPRGALLHADTGPGSDLPSTPRLSGSPPKSMKRKRSKGELGAAQSPPEEVTEEGSPPRTVRKAGAAQAQSETKAVDDGVPLLISFSYSEQEDQDTTPAALAPASSPALTVAVPATDRGHQSAPAAEERTVGPLVLSDFPAMFQAALDEPARSLGAVHAVLRSAAPRTLSLGRVVDEARGVSLPPSEAGGVDAPGRARSSHLPSFPAPPYSWQ